jgi:NAD-dependent deacetylase
MAGNPSVLELHGNIRRVRCSVCGEFAGTWEDAYGVVPACDRCGGLLRPDVVWFGESLPGEILARAVEAVRRCQVFLSIGTSGLVQPAASLAYGARQAGATVVEVNPEPTPLTPDADFYLQGKSGEILPGLVQAAWPESPRSPVRPAIR